MKILTLVFTGMLLAGQPYAQNNPQPAAQNQEQEYYRTPVPDDARFHIFQAGTIKRWTFLLDKYTGRVWAKLPSDDGQTWKKTIIPKMPTLSAERTNKVNYQIFLSQHGQGGFFLLCVETGHTWFLGQDDEKNLTWIYINPE